MKVERTLKVEKSSYRWLILAVCMMVYCTAELVRWNYTGIAKYLITDWNIGKPELGILGSAFFYAYALGQIPWGTATDKFGGRKIIPFGIGAVSMAMAGFAFCNSYQQGIIFRALLGFTAAAAFIPSSSLISKWFSKKERGFAMQMFSGTGGGMGEAMTFLLIPVFAIMLNHGGTFLGLDGWHGSTMIMACIVLAIAAIGATFLRSDPTELGLPSIQLQEDGDGKKEPLMVIAKTALTDSVFWVFTIVFSGFIVGTRLVPAWIALYATEFYIQSVGLSQDAAIIAGGSMAVVYVLGRSIGTPIVGLVSDFLLKRGIPRAYVIWVAHMMLILMYYSFTLPIPNTFMMGVLAFTSGILINLFPLMTAVGVEIWSIRTCGMLMGIVNSVSQFIGAMALSASGFMAVRYSVQGGAFYTQFNGIWYLGLIYSSFVGVVVTYFAYTEYKRAKLRGNVQSPSKVA
jgi:sugar phosphate permease